VSQDRSLHLMTATPDVPSDLQRVSAPAVRLGGTCGACFVRFRARTAPPERPESTAPECPGVAVPRSRRELHPARWNSSRWKRLLRPCPLRRRRRAARGAELWMGKQCRS
jgi:hypothetical protein